MKESTKEIMKTRGLTLPEGWTAEEDGSYSCRLPSLSGDDSVSCWCALSDTFELTVGTKPYMTCFTVPYEVMQAMYLDVGVFGVRIDEAKYIESLRMDRDKYMQKCEHLEKQGALGWKHAEHVEKKLRKVNSTRFRHFWRVLCLRRELSVVTRRIHRQRVANRKLRTAAADLDFYSRLAQQCGVSRKEAKMAFLTVLKNNQSMVAGS